MLNVESQVHNMIQGDMTMTEYYGQLMWLWQSLDLDGYSDEMLNKK